MQTHEIIHPLREAIAHVRNLLAEIGLEDILPTRETVGVLPTTARSLPQLSIEDLFEAELGKLVYGRSLLVDPVTHYPLDANAILDAMHIPTHHAVRVNGFVKNTMAALYDPLIERYRNAALVTFWFRDRGVMTLRVVTDITYK